MLQRVIQADRAVPARASGDWLLDDVRIYDANMNVIRPCRDSTAMAGVTPAQLTLAKVDPDELDYWTLKQPHRRARSGRPPDRRSPRRASRTRSPARSRPC